MAAIYSNGGNRWNILGFNFTKRDALSTVYKISMGLTPNVIGSFAVTWVYINAMCPAWQQVLSVSTYINKQNGDTTSNFINYDLFWL
jgi:hypothetical protein